MHVAVITYTDVDYGFDLANALSRVGTAVTLYQSRRHVARAIGCSSERLDGRLRGLQVLDTSAQLSLFELPRMRDPRNVAAIAALSRLIRENGTDVANILLGGGEIWMTMLAAFLSKSQNVPVSTTMLVPEPNPREEPPAPVQKLVNWLASRWTDNIIANGVSQVELVREKYGLPRRQISCVELGPRTTAAKWASGLTPEQPGTVLFFGQIKPYKGLEYLIRAQPLITRQIPNARIVVAGYGDKELERCRQFIQDDTRFEIHSGFIPDDLMAELFQRASLVVLPYTSASTSGILMTAYVFGKPVVVSRVGSLPEYVEEGITGLLVPPGDVSALAGAVVKLLGDDAARRHMGENALRRVETEQRKIALQSIDAYDTAVWLHGRRSASSDERQRGPSVDSATPHE